jgi:hypothetical protein
MLDIRRTPVRLHRMRPELQHAQKGQRVTLPWVRRPSSDTLHCPIEKGQGKA